MEADKLKALLLKIKMAEMENNNNLMTHNNPQPQKPPMHPLDAAALGTSPIPWLGDIMGLAADARMYKEEPESRTVPNAMMSIAGMLPFVPNAAALKMGTKLSKKLNKQEIDLFKLQEELSDYAPTARIQGDNLFVDQGDVRGLYEWLENFGLDKTGNERFIRELTGDYDAPNVIRKMQKVDSIVNKRIKKEKDFFQTPANDTDIN